MKRPTTIPGMLWYLARQRVRARHVALPALALAAGALATSVHHRAPEPAPAPEAAPLPVVNAAPFEMPIDRLWMRARAAPDRAAARVFERLEAVRARAEGAQVLFPVIAWNGRHYGVFYGALTDYELPLRFVRVSPQGERVGEPVTVSAPTSYALFGRARAAGTDFAATWTALDDDFIGVGFARVTAEGVRAGEPQRLTDPDELNLWGAPAWTGSDYGVAYVNLGEEHDAVRFQRLNARGERVGEARTVVDRTYVTGTLDLAWTQRHHALAYVSLDVAKRQSVVTLAGLDASGAPKTSLEVWRSDEWAENPFVSPDEQSLGVVWNDAVGRLGRSLPRAARVRLESVEQAPRALGARGLYGEVHIATGARGYALTWRQRRGEREEIWFAQYNRQGAALGSPLRLDSNDSVVDEFSEADVVWNGTEYAVVWAGADARRGGVWFVRVSAEGQKVGVEVPVVQTARDANTPQGD